MTKFNGYHLSELTREISVAKQHVRQTHKGRVYFDEPTFSPITGFLQLRLPFRVADGNGSFVNVAGSPEQEYHIALW